MAHRSSKLKRGVQHNARDTVGDQAAPCSSSDDGSVVSPSAARRLRHSSARQVLEAKVAAAYRRIEEQESASGSNTSTS